MTYRRSSPTILAAAVLVWLAVPAFAQAPDTDDDLIAPPHLSVVDGAADLDRDGASVPAEAGQILAAGDRLTTRGGRVEVLFGDGSALHLDHGTTIDLLDEDLLRLVEGRAYLHVAPSDPPFEYRVDTPGASIRTSTAGEYRIISGPVSEIAVARGFASISTASGSAALRSGEAIQVRPGQAPGYPMPFNAAAWDLFDRWSQDRRRPRVTTVTSAPLSGPLTAYNSTLTRHGTWAHHHDHGQVWYPHVQAGWRPFYNGRWATLQPYGWTWVGGDPWAWPTHYYGQWGVTPAGAWFWIPGVRWRPAPVHWTVTASHVGWVPWGFGSVDVFGFTVIPRSVFSVNVIVPRHVVRVTHSTLRPLVVAASPPLPRGIAVPRAFGAHRRATVFATRTDTRFDGRPRAVDSRQPRSLPGRRADDDGRLPPIGIDRRAVDRVPVAAERQQTPLREQPALREQPPLRSSGGAAASGGAEWRMPRRDARDDAAPQRAVQRRAEPRSAPRAQPQAAGRSEPRTEPRAERQSAGRSEPRSEPRGESRAEPAPRSSPRTGGAGGVRQRWPD